MHIAGVQAYEGIDQRRIGEMLRLRRDAVRITACVDEHQFNAAATFATALVDFRGGQARGIEGRRRRQTQRAGHRDQKAKAQNIVRGAVHQHFERRPHHVKRRHTSKYASRHYARIMATRSEVPSVAVAPVIDLLTSVQRMLSRELAAAFDAESTTVDQWRILRALAADEGEPMVAIAARLGIAQPTFTRTLDTLASSALLYRTHFPDDRRRIAIQLSPLGKSLLARLDGIAAEHQRSMARRFGPDRVEELGKLLRQFAT
jgi:DNA-binding MarR family transcriptional regulator